MYIMRVDFKNGLHLEFNYIDAGRAATARDTLRNATKLIGDPAHKNDRAQIWDDAGREADFDFADIQSVQLVDIQQETVSIVRAGLIVRDARMQLDRDFAAQMMGQMTPARGDFEPAIGTAPQRSTSFAS